MQIFEQCPELSLTGALLSACMPLLLSVSDLSDLSPMGDAIPLFSFSLDMVFGRALVI